MTDELFEFAATKTADRAPFRLFVPPGCRGKSRLPVILYLHGAGGQGIDNLSQIQSTFAKRLAEFPDWLGCPVVFPQCPKDRYWLGAIAQDAIDALAATADQFQADTRRLYLIGNSLGGFGAWHLLAMRPDIFAAVVTVSGGLLPTPNHASGRQWAPPELLRIVDAPEPYRELAGSVGDIPAWLFHGSMDQTIPVEESRKIVAALCELGRSPRYREYPGAPHDITQQVWSEPELPAWLMKQKRAIAARLR